MASQCADLNPLALSSKPQSPAEGLLSRGAMRNCRGRGSSGSWQRHRQRLGARL